MARIEVQGIVSATDGMPWVQFRQLDDHGALEARFQITPEETRDLAINMIGASMNAVYDAAIVSFFKERDPENYEELSAQMLVLIRQHRADIWGLPDQPDDWREKRDE
jgi:hypothetical protein